MLPFLSTGLHYPEGYQWHLLWGQDCGTGQFGSRDSSHHDHQTPWLCCAGCQDRCFQSAQGNKKIIQWWVFTYSFLLVWGTVSRFCLPPMYYPEQWNVTTTVTCLVNGKCIVISNTMPLIYVLQWYILSYCYMIYSVYKRYSCSVFVSVIIAFPAFNNSKSISTSVLFW